MKSQLFKIPPGKKSGEKSKRVKERNVLSRNSVTGGEMASSKTLNPPMLQLSCSAATRKTAVVLDENVCVLR